MNKKASFYLDAEEFTNRMIYLTKNDMQNNKLSQDLSPLAENIIRIINIDVEDRMELIEAPSGKIIIILFAKDTEFGLDSAYVTERVESGIKTIDIIVLPNGQLIDKINNAEMLSYLNNVYAFILETKKASAEYISPIEIFKDVFARHYFKMKYFVNAFQLDDVTVGNLKEDIDKNVAGMLSYDQIINVIQSDISVADLFDNNVVLNEMDSELYFHIIDELSGEFDEES